MKDYQKRMIEEFKELNGKTVELEYFLNDPKMQEKRDAMSEDVIAAMHCVYSGMVVHRTNLAACLETMGLAEHMHDYPDVKVGEIFETDRGEILKYIGHEESGCPICEIIRK